MHGISKVTNKEHPIEPYVWQEIDIQALLNGGMVALLNIQMGGGKTVIATEAMLRSDAKQVLVIAPLSTHESAWGNTVRQQSGIETRVIGTKNKAQKEAYTDFLMGVPGWYVATPQWFTRTATEDWAPDAVIVDEALALTTPVLTPKGWSTIGSLKVGDHVYGADGEPTKVTRLFPVQYGKKTYELMLSTGETIVADAGHKWVARPQSGTEYLKPREVTTQEMVDRGCRWAIDPRPVVNLPEATQLIDPYLMGQWLGNGSRKQRYVTVRSELTDAFIMGLNRRGVEAYVTEGSHTGRDNIERVSVKELYDVMPHVYPEAWASKTVPSEYIHASVQQRLDFLRGLMDSDGYVSPNGLCTFTNTNFSMVEAVREIARSLGFKTQGVKTVQDNQMTKKTCYRINFQGTAGLSPFLLRGDAYRDLRTSRAHQIVSIKEVDSVPVRCIEVEAKDHLFLAGTELVPTHNCHKLGNPEGAGAKKLIALGGRVKYKLALSGTPARNNFQRMWTIMRFLWPDNIEIARENYYGWLSEHMLYAKVFTGMKEDKFSGRKKPTYAKKYIRERSQGNLLKRAPLVIQHFRREQCCVFHPEGFLSQDEPQVLTATVELLPEQKKAIKELEEQYLTWLEDNPLVVEIPLTLQQRVRQICLGLPTFGDDGSITFSPDMKSPFADELDEILERLDDDEPVVVYVESQRFAEALTARLVNAGHSAFEYSGATTKTRSQNLATFGREGGHRILVGTISSIGEGTDGMQRVAKTEVFLERSTDETLNQQAESRLDRTGAIGQVQRHMLVDSEGYAAGRWSKQVEKAMTLRKSLVKEVDIQE